MGRVGKFFLKVLLYSAIAWVVLVLGLTFSDDGDTRTVYPSHTENFYIEDYSGVLNEETERYILDTAVSLKNQTKAQVVVVTVPNTHRDSIEQYSIAIANRWGIGGEKEDNGILLLFDTNSEEPHVRLEIGKGLEGAINDAKAGRILDEYAVEAKDQGKWNKAAGNTFTALVKEVYGEYGIECPDTVALKDDWNDQDGFNEKTFADADFPAEEVVESQYTFWQNLYFSMIAGLFLLPFVVIFVILALLGSGRRNSSGYSGSSSGGGSGGHSGGGGSFGGGGATR